MYENRIKRNVCSIFGQKHAQLRKKKKDFGFVLCSKVFKDMSFFKKYILIFEYNIKKLLIHLI